MPYFPVYAQSCLPYLTLFLFAIVGEALNRMLSKAEVKNLISGFKASSNAPAVYRLQYADDTLLFCDVEDNQVKIWSLFSDALMQSLAST